ncbi:hypothetical protein QUF84_00980 [Fictibacillus enclensis]|uniref:hypothetical protein n=1 Tax=Fictibacillus enclensis TaxID=1017270 RepID=UPI0025A13AB5|nr:hypothetical protein [Fictibacillus enclensis]MDM5196631.1 hypothetical protein [Fictibacillus enclensis]MDM5335868.1 hypothetical protein [Fictibacillus enclensis]
MKKLVAFNVRLSWVIGFYMSLHIMFYPDVRFSLIEAWSTMIFAFSYAIFFPKFYSSMKDSNPTQEK